MNTHIYRQIAAVVLLFVLAAQPGQVVAQDDFREVSFAVNLDKGGKLAPEEIEYARFKSRNAAVAASNLLRVAIRNDFGSGVEKAMADVAESSNGGWQRSDHNGMFTVPVMDGMAILLFCDREEVKVVEIEPGKDSYPVVVQLKTSLTNVDVISKRLRSGVTFGSGISEDEGSTVRFQVKADFPAGYGRDDSRLIVQPMVVDCQTEDTISYLDGIVYEGVEYHPIQDRRMRFRYDPNDPLHRIYRSNVVLHDNQPFSVDTTYVFSKPKGDRKAKDKTYKCLFYCVLEDYHKAYYNNGGQGTGSCNTYRRFKFLDFSVASAEMDITKFRQEAEAKFNSVPRNLMLTFVVNSDQLTDDSTNQIEFDNLTEELRSYGKNLFRVTVEATSSPEGAYQHNMELARRRAARALSIIRQNLGRADVQLPAPKVRVCSWEELVDELAGSVADTSMVAMVRNVVASNEPRAVYAKLRALPFYDAVIAPALVRLRSMTCSYTVETNRPMTADEAAAKYFASKADYISGKKNFGADFSDGDLYNLYNTIKDTLELDTITDLAYAQLVKKRSYELYKFAPYLANRKALLNLKRGTPDLEVLRPFILLGDNRIPIRNPNQRQADKNYKEMIINQAITYFQEQEIDSAQSMVNWVLGASRVRDRSDSTLAKLEMFITLRKHYGRYLQNACTPEQRDSVEAAYEFVVENNIVNKAAIYAEFRTVLGLSTEEVDRYVDMLDDGNAKKWYLKGMIWSDKAGQEQAEELNSQAFVGMSAEERARYNELTAWAAGDNTPHFLAYFQHSFDIEPGYRKLFAVEGNVTDEVRERYPYDDDKADQYRKKFDALYTILKANKAVGKAAEASTKPTAAAPAQPTEAASDTQAGGEASDSDNNNGNETK